MYVDEASNKKGSGMGLVLISPEKIVIEKSLRLDFSTTNNEAEYEALLMGMTMVQRMGRKSIKVFLDLDRKSTRLNSSHVSQSRMPSSA